MKPEHEGPLNKCLGGGNDFVSPQGCDMSTASTPGWQSQAKSRKLSFPHKILHDKLTKSISGVILDEAHYWWPWPNLTKCLPCQRTLQRFVGLQGQDSPPHHMAFTKVINAWSWMVMTTSSQTATACIYFTFTSFKHLHIIIQRMKYLTLPV